MRKISSSTVSAFRPISLLQYVRNAQVSDRQINEAKTKSNHSVVHLIQMYIKEPKFSIADRL